MDLRDHLSYSVSNQEYLSDFIEDINREKPDLTLLGRYGKGYEEGRERARKEAERAKKKSEKGDEKGWFDIYSGIWTVDEEEVTPSHLVLRILMPKSTGKRDGFWDYMIENHLEDMKMQIIPNLESFQRNFLYRTLQALRIPARSR